MMTILRAVTVVFAILVTGEAFPQSQQAPQVSKVETEKLSLAEELQLVTVRLEGKTKNGSIKVGTGFLYQHKGRVFIVTNKHVISDVTTGSFVLRKAVVKNKIRTPAPGAGFVIPFTERNFVGHPSNAIDVAAMNISDVVDKLEASGNMLFMQVVTNEIRPTNADLEKFISPIENILFVGYPNGIWDSKNLLPIVRKGITATPYGVHFLGEPKFLIDASVFPGSSGSPVFIYYSGSYPDKSGNLYSGSHIYFLGILAAVFHETEQGEIKIREVPTAQVPYTEVKQMIGLGIVFDDSTVVECLDNYLDVASVQTGNQTRTR